eukprot:jgi/Chrzof1/14098/Cz08g25020.t1
MDELAAVAAQQLEQSIFHHSLMSVEHKRDPRTVSLNHASLKVRLARSLGTDPAAVLGSLAYQQDSTALRRESCCTSLIAPQSAGRRAASEPSNDGSPHTGRQSSAAGSPDAVGFPVFEHAATTAPGPALRSNPSTSNVALLASLDPTSAVTAAPPADDDNDRLPQQTSLACTLPYFIHTSWTTPNVSCILNMPLRKLLNEAASCSLAAQVPVP